MARPRKYSKQLLKELQGKFEEYIATNTVPIICEFAYQNDIPRQVLYDNPEFSTLLKKCIDKKEANLEKGALSGNLNSSAAIFSLKQLGWSDKKQVEHSGAFDVDLTVAREKIIEALSDDD